jgi:hypothetical protein
LSCCAGLHIPLRTLRSTRRRSPNLWRVTDALTWIAALLAVHPEGEDLAAFLPPIAPYDPNRTVRVRTAVASTLLAGRELAREVALTITHEMPMSQCWIRHPG